MYFKLLILIISFSSWGKVLQDEKSVQAKIDFPLRKVCDRLIGSDSPLNDIKTIKSFECMGQIFKTNDFCLKEFPKRRNLMRSFIVENSIRCVFGARVQLKVACPEKAKYCNDAQLGCEYLREDFANQLINKYNFLSHINGKKILTCRYESKEYSTIDNSNLPAHL